MAVPWTGFPFKALIDLVEPKSEATYVRMVTFFRPSQAPGQRTLLHYPWPYYEGLTMAEAMNELAFLVTGMTTSSVSSHNLKNPAGTRFIDGLPQLLPHG